MGSYYFMVKIVMLLNAMLQIAALNWIIGGGTWKWGFEVLGDILAGIKWTDTWRFPMTTFCDFKYHNNMG